MQEEEILSLVITYLTKEFEVDREKIHPAANLFTELGLDSIDALDWFAAMESQIGLPIVEGELKKIRTVQDVVNYVLKNRPARFNPAA